MRRTLIAVAAVLVMAGAGAYYALFILPDQQFRAAIDRTVAALPKGVTAHYGEARYAVSSRTATVTDLLFQLPDGVRLTVDRIVVENPAQDFGDRWNAAREKPDALRPDWAVPVADRIVLTGLKLAGAKSSATTASMSLAGLRIYPWPLHRPAVPPLDNLVQALEAFSQAADRVQAYQNFRRMQVQGAPDAGQSVDAAPLSPAEKDALGQKIIDSLPPILRGGSAMLLSFGYDSLDIAGLEMTVSSKAADTGKDSAERLSMRKFHAGALDRGNGGASTVEELAADESGSGKSSIDRATMGNLTLRDMAMRLVNGDPLSMAILDGVSVGPMELYGTAENPIVGVPSRTDKIALSDLSFDRSFLKSFGIAVTGSRIDVAAARSSPQKALLERYGLRSLTTSLTMAFQWDPDRRSASLHDVSFDIAELGSIQLYADLVNIGPAKTGEAGEVAFSKATLRYRDATLIDRLLAAGGKQTPDQLQQMRMAYVMNVLKAFGPVATDPKLAGSVKALQDFAKAPRNMTITLAPPAPVPLKDMKGVAAQGPKKLIDTLGLSVSANQ